MRARFFGPSSGFESNSSIKSGTPAIAATGSEICAEVSCYRKSVSSSRFVRKSLLLSLLHEVLRTSGGDFFLEGLSTVC